MLASLPKKKQICKTQQVILMISKVENPHVQPPQPLSAYKIHFPNPIFILVIVYLADFIHNLVFHLTC